MGSLKEQCFDKFPCGWQFLPTDQELVQHYLLRKIRNQSMPPHRIRTIDLHQTSLHDIAKMCQLRRENKLYFFTKRDDLPSRAAGDGYWTWRPSDTVQHIYNNGDVIAYKRKLDCYSPQDVRTNWEMVEFQAADEKVQCKICDRPKVLDDVVLCVIYMKNEGKKEEKEEKEEVEEESGSRSNKCNSVEDVNGSSSSSNGVLKRKATGLLEDIVPLHILYGERRAPN